RAYGLDPGPFHDVVLEKLVKRFRLRDVFVEKAAVGLFSHAPQQGGDGRLDVSDEPEINGRPAPDVLGILVDLDFLHAFAREELREGEVSAKHQQEVGLLNGAVGSAVNKQDGHTDR